MATLKCVQEDRVVNDALCPVNKPAIIRKCNTCENGCNPDGSCVPKYHQNEEICNFITYLKLAEHIKQILFCKLKCCECNN